MTPVLRTLRPVADLIRLIIPPLILAVGLWTGWMLFKSKPVPKVEKLEEVATVVQTVVPPMMDTSLDVTAWGTVKPSQELSLRPEVAGRLDEVSDRFVPGGVFRQGDVLARIDQRDYHYALQQALAGLETARFNLEVEEGRGRVAQRDWELLGEVMDADAQGSRMALRAPHLAEKKASLASAESRVEQAQLALERTIIKAPFNAIIQMESAEVGQIVSSATTLGTLVGTDAYWVEIGVPLADVALLNIIEGDDRSAKISLSTGGGEDVTYAGRIAGLTGSVDEVGRLVRLLIAVPNPLEQSSERTLPLLLGSYVAVTVEGPTVHGVRALPRAVIREGDVVWIAGRDNRLAIRAVEIVGGDARSVLGRVALGDEEAIISSPLPAAAPGMLLQRALPNIPSGNILPVDGVSEVAR